MGPWTPWLGVVGAILVLGWLGMDSRPKAALRSVTGDVWVDPAELCWEEWSVELDPRWAEELRSVVARLRPFPVEDHGALMTVAQALRSLSFVERVAVEASAEEGLAVELALRAPVACIPVGRSFQTVDSHGVLLTGLWPTPVRAGGCPLPVLGPMSDANGLFLAARAGDHLAEADHVDALDVALSMQRHLGRTELRDLGSVVIDATRGRRASVEEPGVRIVVQDQRLILFGRPPAIGGPGELPAANKWASVAAALHQLRQRGTDWELLDVRWDRPEIVLGSDQRVAALDPGRTRARPVR